MLGRSKAAIRIPLDQKEVFECPKRRMVVFKPLRTAIVARSLSELVGDQAQQGNPKQHEELLAHPVFRIQVPRKMYLMAA